MEINKYMFVLSIIVNIIAYSGVVQYFKCSVKSSRVDLINSDFCSIPFADFGYFLYIKTFIIIISCVSK